MLGFLKMMLRFKKFSRFSGIAGSVFNSFSPFDIQEEQIIIIKSLDPLRAKKF